MHRNKWPALCSPIHGCKIDMFERTFDSLFKMSQVLLLGNLGHFANAKRKILIWIIQLWSTYRILIVIHIQFVGWFIVFQIVFWWGISFWCGNRRTFTAANKNQHPHTHHAQNPIYRWTFVNCGSFYKKIHFFEKKSK